MSNNISEGNCNFLSTKCFINVYRSSWSTDCAAENSKTRVMLRERHCRRWEHQHVVAANARADSAAAEVRACMHNWSIWCQRSSRTIGCVMAHSKKRPCIQSIVQSIQLGFSCSLGATTANVPYKSAMRCAEWTITARRALLCLAQMKYRYFFPERCKQNASFSGTSHQNGSYLDNISTNGWYTVGFQQGQCSRAVTNENFKITVQVLQD